MEFALQSKKHAVLEGTCEKVSLKQLVDLPGTLSQDLLIRLLEGLASNVMSSPLKRLEWIESVAGAIDQPTSPEAAKNLQNVAREAREALTRESQSFANLGSAAARFRIVLKVLRSLEMGEE